VPSRSLPVSPIPLAGLAGGFLAYALATGGGPGGFAMRVLCLLRAWAILSLLLCLWNLMQWVSAFYADFASIRHTFNAIAGEAVYSPGLFDLTNRFLFGHANYVAALAVLTVALAPAAWLLDGSKWRRVWAALLLPAALVILVSTDSRAAFGGAFAAGAVWLVFFLVRRGVGNRALAGTVAALALLAIAFTAAVPSLRQTAASVVTGELGRSDFQRMGYLAAGWEMGLDRPLTGQGPGTVSYHYPRFWDGQSRLDQALQLHNTPAQLWAETGLLGLAAFTALALAGLACLLPLVARWRSLATLPAGLSAGILAAALGYLPLLLTDYQLDVPYIAATFALAGGLLAATRLHAGSAARAAPPRRRLRRACGLLVAGCLAVLAWSGGHGLHHRAQNHAGLAALNQGDIERFVQTHQAAAAWDPAETLPLNRLGFEFARIARAIRSAQPEAAAALRQRALGFFEESLHRRPCQEYPLTQSGWLLLDGGEPARALTAFQRALQAAPSRRSPSRGLALAASRLLGEPAYALFALEGMAYPEQAVQFLDPAVDRVRLATEIRARLSQAGADGALRTRRERLLAARADAILARMHALPAPRADAFGLDEPFSLQAALAKSSFGPGEFEPPPAMRAAARARRGGTDAAFHLVEIILGGRAPGPEAGEALIRSLERHPQASLARWAGLLVEARAQPTGRFHITRGSHGLFARNLDGRPFHDLNERAHNVLAHAALGAALRPVVLPPAYLARERGDALEALGLAGVPGAPEVP